jgi:hypothetical protein
MDQFCEEISRYEKPTLSLWERDLCVRPVF